MRLLPSTGYLPALLGILLLGSLFSLQAETLPDASRRPYTGITLALGHDLAAIPTGSQPTAAQTQTVANDLAKLFRPVADVPTVTLDYVAARLADAVSQGTLTEGDLSMSRNE